MTVSVRVSADVAIFDLDGRMTVNRGGEPLVDHVTRWLALAYRHQVLDFARVSYMDSTCLGEIVTAHQLLLSRGGCLALMHVPQRIQRLLDIAGLEMIRILTSDQELAQLADREALALGGG